MPPYRALFDGAPDRPRQEARDLVTYLETLGRARELAGPEGEARAREACNCPDDEMAQMAFGSAAERAPGAHAAQPHEAPALPLGQRPARAGNSSTRATARRCHGAAAKATARAAPPCCRVPPTSRSTTTRWPACRRLVEWRRRHGDARVARPPAGGSRRDCAGGAGARGAQRAPSPRAAAPGSSWASASTPPIACSATASAATAAARRLVDCPWRRSASGGNGRPRPTACACCETASRARPMAPWTSRLTDAELAGGGPTTSGASIGAAPWSVTGR